jgi:ABC-type spermidine/putrescine transport system, permease component II
MGLRIFSYAVIAIVIAPMLVIIATSFTTASYLSFPPIGFTLKWYEVALRKTEFLDSFYFSLRVAVAAAIVATILGALVAIVLTRFRVPGRAVIDAFFMSPLVLPTIVIGIALLQYLSRLHAPMTTEILVLGHVVITTPYVIRLVTASLAGIDLTCERAARNLGAHPVRAFWEVTFPLITPGLGGGATFAFITSFDNVTISVFLATPSRIALPVRIFNLWDQPIEPWLIAICAMVIVFTVVLIALIERTIGVRGVLGRT